MNYDKQLLVDFMEWLVIQGIFPMEERIDVNGEEQHHHVFDFHLLYDKYLEDDNV